MKNGIRILDKGIEKKEIVNMPCCPTASGAKR
jgi:hypothetical protein